MIRIIAILVGLGFAAVALISFVVGAYTFATEETAPHLPYEEPMDIDYAFDGPLGTWDIAQLQRGYKVYKEVCSACHGLKFVAFRNLAELGYSEAQVKAEAATWQVPGVDPNTGEATMRAAEPTDYFPSPYPNAVAAAAANNNAIPPELSLPTTARGAGTNSADVDRRRRLPDLDRRAHADQAQADRLAGADLPPVRHRAGLYVEAADLVRGQTQAPQGLIAIRDVPPFDPSHPRGAGGLFMSGPL